ncbi:MAG: CHAT domain-containing protein [Candidatus Aminicenantes bacterium]|nr:MAG: CHAT domain-containing protein [Candidatus Aminicenantes bacterium]
MKLILIAQILFLYPNQILFPFQNPSSSAQKSVFKEKYSEYFEQGENFKRQGNYEKSIQFFTQALNLAQKNGEIENEIESFIQLGVLYWNIGQLVKSLSVYQEALSRAEKTRVLDKKVEILNYIKIYELYQGGKDHRSKEEYQKSIENFEKAIELSKQIASKEHQVKCLRQLSVTYSELNDLDELFSLSKEAQKIAFEIKHKKEEGRCLYNIGLYYDAIDNYSQALLHYEEALRISRIFRDFFDESDCLTNISQIYIHLGNYDKALEYLEEVLRIDKQLEDDAYVAIDLNNIGVTYQKKALHSENKDDLYNALESFKESLKIARIIKDIKTEIQALTNIGMVQIDLENFPEALRYFDLGLEKADKSQDKEEIANIYVNIGIVHSKQENFDLSIANFKKAIETASEIKGDKILWEAYFEIANTYMNQNNYQKSQENYKKSISHLEKIRSKIQLEELKASYLGTDKRIDTYYNLIDLLAQFDKSEPKKGHDIEAFHYMEKAKARAFLDRLEVSQINISQGVDTQLLNQEKELMKEISNLNTTLLTPGLHQEQKKEIDDQIKLHEEQLEAIMREIRISSPAYANLKDPEIISLELTQEQLPDNETAYFEYSIGKKKSYAFAITKRGLKIFPLPSTEKIQAQVNEYLMTITDKENEDFDLGYELFYSLILPGLEKNINKLIFIPDDILHYLPFETLITQKNEKRWLIKDYKVSYAPSISSLRGIIQCEALNGQKPQKDILAFGDPFFGPDEEETAREALKDFSSADTSSFFRLKYSGLEIDKIQALFKKAKIDIFKRKEATEERLKKLNLADYKILHLATHCLIDNEKPARSSIIFSLEDTSSEDGFLQMREIFNLKLNSDLVSLSACETGLGQFIRGEGIDGLSRAFFYAGASSVLMSLWAVHDQATSQFMQRYYFHLRSSNTIMDSLHKTKLEMIDSDVLSHPYYWAGFVVTGRSDKTIYPSATKKLIIIILLIFLIVGASSLIIFKKFSNPSSPSS